MKNYKLTLGFVLLVSILFTGCMIDSKQMILENEQQLKVRSFQIKKYDKPKKLVARATISTLQDLSFIIDKADMETGTVTATKLAKGGASMRITIVIREKGENLTQVRSNAQFSSSFNQMPKAVTAPETYQAFYTALDKALFLDKAGL